MGESGPIHNSAHKSCWVRKQAFRMAVTQHWRGSSVATASHGQFALSRKVSQGGALTEGHIIQRIYLAIPSSPLLQYLVMQNESAAVACLVGTPQQPKRASTQESYIIVKPSKNAHISLVHETYISFPILHRQLFSFSLSKAGRGGATEITACLLPPVSSE